MGQSTDAILCFGVDFGDEHEFPWETEEEYFEDWFYNLHGLSTDALWAEYHAWAEEQGGASWREYEQVCPSWKDALNDLYEQRKEALKSCPIEFVRHCSGDYPMWIVAVKGTVRTAYRGRPIEISIDSLTDCAEMEIRAEAFCAEHGIPFEDPQWLLASDWS